MNAPLRFSVAPDVLSAHVDGETVLLSRERGTYFGLNDAGARVWDGLACHATRDEIRDALVRAYAIEPDTASRDIGHLFDDLVRHHLVVERSELFVGPFIGADAVAGTGDRSDMRLVSRPADTDERRDYLAPELTRLGDVTELTAMDGIPHGSL